MKKVQHCNGNISTAVRSWFNKRKHYQTLSCTFGTLKLMLTALSFAPILKLNHQNKKLSCRFHGHSEHWRAAWSPRATCLTPLVCLEKDALTTGVSSDTRRKTWQWQERRFSTRKKTDFSSTWRNVNFTNTPFDKKRDCDTTVPLTGSSGRGCRKSLEILHYPESSGFKLHAEFYIQNISEEQRRADLRPPRTESEPKQVNNLLYGDHKQGSAGWPNGRESDDANGSGAAGGHRWWEGSPSVVWFHLLSRIHADSVKSINLICDHILTQNNLNLAEAQDRQTHGVAQTGRSESHAESGRPPTTAHILLLQQQD